MNTAYFRNHPFGRFLGKLVGSLVLALIVTPLIISDKTDSFREFFITFSWTFVVCFTQWLGHSYIFGVLDRKISWQEHPVKRAIYGSIGIIAYAVLAYIVVMVAMSLIVNHGLPENPVKWALLSSLNTVLISFAVCVVLLTIGFFQRWKSSLIEAERFKAEMLRYKYEALQNQINPHFLFNSFNVLSDLVYEDQKKAVDFISRMSQLFRYVLDSRDKELVPVTEELEFMASFSYLLQSRFENKLSIEINVKASPDDMVVPMTLQMLVENCVKHNEISAAKPLSIQVINKNNSIVVINNLQKKPVGEGSTKTGLSNIRQQYGFFTDREIIVYATEASFSVEIPVINAS